MIFKKIILCLMPLMMLSTGYSAEPELDIKTIEAGIQQLEIRESVYGVVTFTQEQFSPKALETIKYPKPLAHYYTFDNICLSILPMHPKDILNLLSSVLTHRSIFQESKPMNRYDISDSLNFFFFKKDDKYHGCFTKRNYPGALAFTFLNEIDMHKNIRDLLKDFNGERLKNHKITQIKEELEDTKTILIEDINKLIERGEHIEELVDKATTLEMESWKLKKKTEDLNSCCTIF